MLTKSVDSWATTATHAGCVQRSLGHNTPFSGRGSKNAVEDDPRPNVLQLNTEGLTASKISIIEQLAYKNKAFIIILQETHCTTADKLVIPNFSLAGSDWPSRINNSSKCSNCYGPRAFGGPAVFCDTVNRIYYIKYKIFSI